MDLKELKEKLRKYKKEDIIITEHAKIQAYAREVDLEEVKTNILNPERLVYAKEQESQNSQEEKYDCYFAYSKTLCHRYIIVLNRKLLIVTIIKINRNWQKIVER
jgi:hypothetical protein